uniref:Flocculation protein FLO11-like n=1 Tax=Nicotiana tabacum TaxID=4097 RepID=A0A1S3XJK3_TOBAC|nr:PREDICTED: uncharacterized protein LOC107765908 [Nicotiana tabacum]
MVKQRGRDAKQPRRGDSSRGGKGKQVKLTSQPKLKTRKQIAIDYQSRSEYIPSRDLSSDLGPATAVPASHTAQAPQRIHFESSDGSIAGSGEYSTSPTASVSGESAEGGTNSDNEVSSSGCPSLKGPDNPKDKSYKPPSSTPAGQSEEPVAIVSSVEPPSEPSTMPTVTTDDDLPPRPSSFAGPSTSVDTGVPSDNN